MIVYLWIVQRSLRISLGDLLIAKRSLGMVILIAFFVYSALGIDLHRIEGHDIPTLSFAIPKPKTFLSVGTHSRATVSDFIHCSVFSIILIHPQVDIGLPEPEDTVTEIRSSIHSWDIPYRLFHRILGQ